MANPSGTYDSSFYAAQEQGSRVSASVVLTRLREIVQPTSVLDVGCGVGTWVADWLESGVTDVLGIDGAYIDPSSLHIPPEHFQSADLSEPLDLGRRFDLVQSLEVAEHLQGDRADTFVESLTKHADMILFSAAIPRQGGTHHVNEQWVSYWLPKFAVQGYRVFDVIRPAIWTDQRCDLTYRQNSVLLSKNTSFGPEGADDLVHPELWMMRTAPRYPRFGTSRPRYPRRCVSPSATDWGATPCRTRPTGRCVSRGRATLNNQIDLRTDQ